MPIRRIARGWLFARPPTPRDRPPDRLSAYRDGNRFGECAGSRHAPQGGCTVDQKTVEKVTVEKVAVEKVAVEKVALADPAVGQGKIHKL